MARIRTVKPDLFKSPSMRHLPIQARYLAVGLLTEADDEGVFIASSKLLAGSLFPHDDDVSAARVEGWLQAIAGIGMIELYEIEGVRYGSFPKWADHQKISHPTLSRLPNRSGEVPAYSRNGSVLNLEREQGKGKGSAEVSAAFDIFWKACPLKKGKIAAKKAYAKALTETEPAVILAAIELYAEEVRDTDPHFIAHPTTWLNAGRWEDEEPTKPGSRRAVTDDDYRRELKKRDEEDK